VLLQWSLREGLEDFEGLCAFLAGVFIGGHGVG
jgi:hypothetical protein